MNRQHHVECSDRADIFKLYLPTPPDGQYTMDIQALIDYPMSDVSRGQTVINYSEHSPITRLIVQTDAYVRSPYVPSKIPSKLNQSALHLGNNSLVKPQASKQELSLNEAARLMLIGKFKVASILNMSWFNTIINRSFKGPWTKVAEKCEVQIEQDNVKGEYQLIAKDKDSGDNIICLFIDPILVRRSESGKSVFWRDYLSSTVSRCKFRNKETAETFYYLLLGMASKLCHQEKLQKFIVSDLRSMKRTRKGKVARKYNELQLIELINCSNDYKLVRSQFMKTAKMKKENLKAIFIYKVEHKGRAEAHEQKRNQILKSLDGDRSKLHELRLYHGTQLKTLPLILHQGFLRQFVSRAKYGKGTYFALDAKYSCNPQYSKPDENGFQHILYCNVICGQWVEGNKKMKVPPPKKDNTYILHETTVNDVSNPTIFVTYQDDQALPTYLICFRT